MSRVIARRVLKFIFRSRVEYTTAEHQRELSVFKNMSSSVVAKLLYAAASLLIIPSALSYLGVEAFGLWSILAALITVVSFLDFGLGYGLLNIVVRYYGESRFDDAKRIVATALLLLTVIGLLSGGLLFLLQLALPLEEIFGLKTEQTKLALESAIPVLLVIVTFAVPATAIRQAQVGIQRAHIANWWEAVSYVAAFLATLLVIQQDGGLAGMLASFFGIPVIFRYFNGLYLLRISGMSLLHLVRYNDMKMVPGLLQAGLLFFVLQLAGVVGFQSDNFIIGSILGAEAVPEYAVAMKIFSIPSTITGFLLMAMWPAYGDAFARREYDWIRRTFWRTLTIIVLVNLPITITLALSAKWIAVNWVDPNVEPTGWLVLAMLIWSLLTILTGAFASLMNGLHIVKFQVVTSVSMAIANISLSILLVEQYGVVGAIAGSILSVLVCIVVPTMFYLRHFFRTQLKL